MTDRPIIFSTSMVRAMLVGGKTQTRRLLKPRGSRPSLLRDDWADSYILDPGNADWLAQEYPYRVGDRLYVREKHWAVERLGHGFTPHLIYDDEWDGGVPDETAPLRPCGLDFGPHPSIHMFRWASRLTLLVDDVRVQRLQEISEADAIAEGVEPPSGDREDYDWSICPRCGGTGLHGALGANLGYMEVDCRDCDTNAKRYRHLWNSLHGAEAWDANPWVVAVTFRVEHGNIDRLDPAMTAERAKRAS